MAKKVKTPVPAPEIFKPSHTAAPAYFVAENIEYHIKGRRVVFGDGKGNTHTVTLTSHGEHQWYRSR